MPWGYASYVTADAFFSIEKDRVKKLLQGFTQMLKSSCTEAGE
jgi:hypothetical protein